MIHRYLKTSSTPALQAAREELLAKLLREEGIEIRGSRKIHRAPQGSPAVLSFAQQSLWFLDQLSPGQSAYNLFRAERITGSLDVSALRQSLQEIIRRHEILRTRFPSVDGQPVASLAETATLDLPLVDLRRLPAEDRHAKARSLAAEEARHAFDIANGPLFRATVLRLRDDDHILLLAAHYIVCDDWSLAILFEEAAILYAAFSVGMPPALPEIPIQYSDFALWQRDRLRGEFLEQQLCYWKRQLEGAPSALELPADRPRPAVQSFRGSRRSFVVSKRITEALKALGRDAGATLFMTVLAAFKTLLYRYTAQEDIVVGSLVASRNPPEVERLIGFFVNTLPLRTDLSRNPTFRELLARVRDVCLGAYAHQDLPFEKLVEELHVQRDSTRNPLFQVMISFQNAPLSDLWLPKLSVSRIGVDSETAKVDLVLYIAETQEGLTGALEYATDLFDASTMQRMVNHFQTLLESIIAGPERRISELALLTDTERHQLLLQWNDTRTDYAAETCIHRLFESQAERVPDAIAVSFENQQLTYRELNERANRLAHQLLGLGIGPEQRVAVCVERSVEMVVAVLAVLKAGGGYVPLDPTDPTERLAFMLQDAGVSVVLTQRHLMEALPQYGAAVLCVDSGWEKLAEPYAGPPAGAISPDNLAYVIFTSGSTGKPKGVQITHRALTNFLDCMRRELGLTDEDTLLAVTTISFDIAALELFLPLSIGARVVVVSRAVASDGDRLLATLVENRATVMQATPTTWRLLVEAGWPNAYRIKVLCGGEALPRDLAAQLLARRISLWNLYGPTESTIWSTLYLVEPSDGPVPIGRPIANTQLYVLDSELSLLPVGVPGDLYIAGAGLARGYLNRPDLTAENFIPNPFSDQPGARMYKTGDLARYLPDGNLEFLGRRDHQVKNRGVRVEPGEIEAALNEHPGVREAVVMARQDFNDAESGWTTAQAESRNPQSKIHNLGSETRLVAYIVPIQGAAPGIRDLRQFLHTKLPHYMVPSVFLMLERLPLTANGKIDRRALPPPESARPDFGQRFEAPRTIVEEISTVIWAEILRVEEVGVHDNFFDLGGHSLLAIRVISRLREAFQVELPLRCLFEAPTVAGLAHRIEEAIRRQQGVSVPPVTRMSRDRELPLSFAQERLWFLDQLEPGSSAYNMPTAIRVKRQLDVGALEQSLNEVVKRHEVLRAAFPNKEGRPCQVIEPALPLTISLVDLRAAPEGEREREARRVALLETEQPFDLARAPLLRASLLRLHEDEYVLLLIMHHIISDGWSRGVLLRELALLYEAFSNGRPAPLPDLPFQYADYAVWQRAWLREEVLQAQLCYWRRQLAGELPSLELPADYSRPLFHSHRGGRQSLVLAADLTAKLKNLCREERVTLFMTMLAAFQTLLHRYTGQEDVIVGSPIAGRNRTELEGLIGFFVNTLVLRTDLSGNPTFRELLARVREVALGAYAHQDVPFDKLVEELRPQRNLSYSPLFQVMFNMFNVEVPEIELAGAAAEPFFTWDLEAKFDLTLYVREQDKQTRVELLYNAQLFTQASMSCFLQQYSWLLEQIVSAPAQPIQSYSLVTPESRPLLPDASSALAEPPQQLVSSLFASWAGREPQRCAISQGERTWSYGELSHYAYTLARVLTANGMKSGEVVAVHGHRSFGTVAGMIAVFSSGGILLLLDDSLPTERKLLMVREAGARRLLLVGDPQPDDDWVSAGFVGEILWVGADKECFAPETTARRETTTLPEVTTDDAAYIFFTSGTTGTPKGVLGVHKGLSHFLEWQRNTFSVKPEDRVAQLTSLSSDAVLRDTFLALTSGATLCLPEGEETFSADGIAGWLHRQRISILHAVPSLARSWIADHAEELSLRDLRLLFFVGEPLTDTLVTQWRAALSHEASIVNLYGPTETTLVKCFYRVPAEVRPGVQPAGSPISDTQALVLGENKQLCGINEPGEIVLRTPFRTRGYVNAPAENDARFVMNPFRNDGRDLLYFTGDIGRYAPDGRLKVLGRFDDQVKIRGVRVEPAEVTAILGRHPAVESCFVLARKDAHDEISLIAYVIASKQQTTSAGQLRSYLVEQLSPALVPASFVFLDELPLAPNGKVNRRALPAPDPRGHESATSYVAPRTALETALAEIWAEVLRLNRVGVYDSFFELGGHSLLAAQVIFRMRYALDLEIPLRAIFENPTVAGIGQAIESSKYKPAAQAGAIVPLSRKAYRMKRSPAGPVPATRADS